MFEKFEIGPRENFFQGKNIFFQNLIFNKKDKIEFEKKNAVDSATKFSIKSDKRVMVFIKTTRQREG